jgi:hypothetical protein
MFDINDNDIDKEESGWEKAVAMKAAEVQNMASHVLKSRTCAVAGRALEGNFLIVRATRARPREATKLCKVYRQANMANLTKCRDSLKATRYNGLVLRTHALFAVLRTRAAAALQPRKKACCRARYA